MLKHIVTWKFKEHADHPQHVALKPFIGAVREARQCRDYIA